MARLRPVLLALGLLPVFAGLHALAQQTGTPETSAPETGRSALYRDCGALTDDEGLRDFIRSSTEAGLRSAIGKADLLSLTRRAWSDLDLDLRYEKLVEKVVESEKNNTAYWKKFLAGYGAGDAEKMARGVLDRVFESPEFAAILKSLTERVGAELARLPSIEAAAADTQIRISQCARDFLAVRYSQTVSDFFVSVTPDFQPPTVQVSAEISLGIALSLAALLSGVTVVLLRKIVVRVIERVLVRVLGRVAARLVAWGTVLAGAALLVWDVWDGANGPFPIIREELLKPETQLAILESYSAALPEGLEDEIKQAAIQQEEALFRSYIDFKNAYRTVLDLTASNARFKSMIDDLSADEFKHLHQVVAILEPLGGREAILQAFDRGTLRRALVLPPEGVTIARNAGSLETALAWHREFPGSLGRILKIDAYKRFSADAIPVDLMRAVLSIEDDGVAAKALALPEATLTVLASLPHAVLAELAGALSRQDLEAAAPLLARIPDASSRSEAANALMNSAKLQTALRNDDLYAAVLQSGDPAASLQAVSEASPANFFSHAAAVFAGRLDFSVFRQIYPWTLYPILGVALLIGMMLIRFFRPLVKVIIGYGRKTRRD